jgi:pimeloyl-ACP methyl ester carboxylesterase
MAQETVAVTYVDVDGLSTWHEVLGEGPPVVLLHGAFAGASSWSAQAPALARAGYRVHVPERRGHAGGDQAMGFLRAEYDQVSPDGPAHFPVVHAKTLRMLATEPELDLASLAAVDTPPWSCRATATR